ncbi:MAG: terminase small subunit [Ignavibacteriaceae bacterium]
MRKTGKDFNGAKSAIRAGYSKKTARQQSARMLTKVNISDFIESLKDKQIKRAELTIEAVLNELQEIGFGKVDGELIKTSEKLKALELLEKYLGMFTEKIKEEKDINVNVRIEIVDKLDEVGEVVSS